MTAKHALLIIDAAHQLEEEFLRGWVENEKLLGDYDHVDSVVIPIAEDPENIPVDILETRFECPDQTDFIPIRVVWRSTLDEPHSRPRIRDLVRGNRRRPNSRHAKRIIEQSPEKAKCIAGKAETFERLKLSYDQRAQQRATPESLSEYIANQAALALDVAERRLRGSRYRIPRRVVPNMLADPSFKEALQEIAITENTSEEALLKRAQGIFKELIPAPTSFWQDTMEAINRQIVSLGYDAVFDYDKDKLNELKALAREKPFVIMWTHKTHVDGFAMASTLFREDFPATHTLGGVNMAFGGLGFVARRSTAIFIRRSFSNDALYKLILRQYLGYLLKKRFPLSWAFEGTRSRVGKLMPPRYGILKYVVDAANNMGLDDLQIIPVALNYDLINDVSDYAAEQQGAIKTPESLRWFINYLRRFKSSHGKIYLDFGNPVQLGGNLSPNSTLEIQKIAFQVGVEANRVSPITFTSVLTLVLLGIAPRALTQQQLTREIEGIVDWAEARNIPYTDMLKPENRKECFKMGEFIVSSGLIRVYDQGPDTVYGISEDQQGIANYYRNTIVHHFIMKSIAELALLRVSDYEQVTLDGFWNQIDLLRDSFKFEFFYTPSEEFRAQVRQELDRYDPEWEEKLASTEGFAAIFLRKLTPHFSHTAILPFIEAYAIVAGIFARLEEGQTISQKDLINQALSYGKQLYLQGRVRSQASIGKLLFENGYKLLESRGLVGEDADQTERENFSRELWAFSQRISEIRAMASPVEFL